MFSYHLYNQEKNMFLKNWYFKINIVRNNISGLMRNVSEMFLEQFL